MNNYVVYDGQAQGMTGMKRGEVNVLAASVSSVIQFIRSGDLKPVLVLSDGEIPKLYQDSLGDVDTLADIDIENQGEVQSLTSFKDYWNWAGPPGIPEEHANVVRDAMSEAIQMQALQDEARENGRTISYTDSTAVGEELSQKVDLWEEYLPLLNDMEKAGSGG
jgi:tripartite-type tricarboxylate transporter receptor subunit TctC